MYREKFRSYGKFKACLPILFLCICTHIHTNLQNVELTSFSTTDTRPLRRIYRKAQTHSFTLKYWLFIVRDHIHKFEISTFFYNGIYQSEIHQLECFADILYCSFRDGKLVYYFIVSTRLYILPCMCMTKAVCVCIYNIHTYIHTCIPFYQWFSIHLFFAYFEIMLLVKWWFSSSIKKALFFVWLNHIINSVWWLFWYRN